MIRWSGLWMALMLAWMRPAAAETLKVAVPQKGNWDTSMVDFGVKQGFFKQEGLDIETIYTQGGAPTLQAVISGSVDIGMATGMLGVVGAFSKGAPVRVISSEMTGASDLFWYAKASSGIKSMADAAGKTVAFSEPGSSTDLVLHALLDQLHVAAKAIPAGGIPGVQTQVMSGQIDIGWSVPPANLQAVDDGTLRIVAQGNDVPAIRDETIRVNFANVTALKSRREAFVKFSRVYVKTMAWAFSDPKAIEYFAAGMNVSPELARETRDKFYSPAAMQPFEFRGKEAMLKQALDYRFIPRALTPSDIAGLFDFLVQDEK